ncbi:hypothetical protein K2173_020823 [Erythroxylum novogranatense]|uniref:Uncharacterized protein n=1 Tax=Erythroxylum novogranatense TaxID=1862640 RepID=A0AAV8TPX1_9ROSI|nr:hypothetical protein K2173_020823 [Erythroxylum novogranatense]
MKSITQKRGFFVLLALWSWSCTLAAATVITKSGCNSTCGNVSVPYPFGVGDPSCAVNENFLLTCNYNSSPAVLQLYNIPVVNISVDEGTMVLSLHTAYDCYNESGLVEGLTTSQKLGDSFALSNTRNKLTVLGCDTLGQMTNEEKTFGSGCFSLCDDRLNFTDYTNCSGVGCCQVEIPSHLKTLNITSASPRNHSHVLDFNPCGFVFLADERTFDISDLRLSATPNDLASYDSVVEWVIEEKNCSEAIINMSSNACRENTDCIYSKNNQGYRCLCKEGFTGNPYLQGCQDINECEDPKTYPCEGTCKNTIGNYTCRCPLGMHGDGKVKCKGFHIGSMVAVIGAPILLVISTLLSVVICKKRTKQRNFFKNGGMLLKHQRVRIFSEAELAKATKSYATDHFLGEGGFGSVYKGILPDNTLVAVKKPRDFDKIKIDEEFQHEINIVSQVNHINVVRLLGLCLETKVPLLVYEFVSNGTLFHHIHHIKSEALLSWRSRLRIAAETASALDYLHSLANPPIIHGDVKSANVLLDDKYTAKVSDFGASVLVLTGQNDVATKIQGTFGYLDPEYLLTGNLTAKSDVYSFGVILVELLTGKKPNFVLSTEAQTSIINHFRSTRGNNELSQLLCFEVADETEMEEIEIFAEIAKECLHNSGIKRPTMKQVAEGLSRLTRLHENLQFQDNREEETLRLLGEHEDSCSYAVSTTSFSIGNYTDSI